MPILTDTPASDPAPSAGHVRGTSRDRRPHGAKPPRILWAYVIVVPAIHLLSLLALAPWFFSWSGLALAIAGYTFFGMLGISIGYHRLLTHQGFTCPKWLERSLATIGICCMQDSPIRWVAIHRKHHQHSDEQPDPHSPFVNFLWAHAGWLMVENRDLSTLDFYDRYARDLLRDPYYRWIEKQKMWFGIYFIHAALFYLAGLAVGWGLSGELMQGVRLGMSYLVWGVFVRTVAVWHGTWLVNSVTHIWGYRNYETSDNSRNNVLVAMVSHGEGWHNNHHADQRSAAHGHRWWECDVTWHTIRLLEMLGLAKDVVRPKDSSA